MVCLFVCTWTQEGTCPSQRPELTNVLELETTEVNMSEFYQVISIIHRLQLTGNLVNLSEV